MDAGSVESVFAQAEQVAAEAEALLVDEGWHAPAPAPVPVAARAGVAVERSVALSHTGLPTQVATSSPLSANPSHLVEWRLRNSPVDINHLVSKFKPLSHHIYRGLRDEGSTCQHC